VTGESATSLLHRLTSYQHDREWDVPLDDPRLVHDFVGNDWDHFPLFYKQYEAALPRIPLPREWQAPDVAAVDVLAGSARPITSDVDLAGLARWLYLSAGVTKYAERRGKRWLFRAAGSAGARFPLELYVAVPDGGNLPAGVHWYDPEAHALVTIADPPAGQSPAVVVTGVPWRTGWRYRERGFRHIYWDAGTMLAQLLPLADSSGFPGALYTRFPDEPITRLVGADGVQEFPVAVIALGPGTPALTPTGTATSGSLDSDAIELPLVTAAQHAGDGDVLGPPIDRGTPIPPPTEAADVTVDEVIAQRGSIRRLYRDRSVPRAFVEASMSAAMRGVDVPHWLVVHAVDGVDPGLYRWPDLATPVRTGISREDTYRVALEQGLAAEAAFVAVSAVPLADVDDRRYREVQLLAGLVEGRLHLMAYALGFAATGMTFRDADIPDLLGEHVACLLWTCVGVPEYRSARGGAPGAPTTVRLTQPRG
jgi:SagB-type dehydrogenase family enzyme